MATSIEIQGSPVYSGRVLKPADPAFLTLSTPDDYCRFANQLRGRYSIIVRTGGATFALTDFGACYPIHYLRDNSGVHHVHSSLFPLRSLVPGTVSPEALYFQALRTGFGNDPLYAGVACAPPATVAEFRAGTVTLRTWLDWSALPEEREISPAQAREQFVETASEYLLPLAREGRTACLLSGGVDSAVVAWLLKQLGADFECLTADYAWKRYSESDQANANAQRLGLRSRRVDVSLTRHRRAFLAMNAPCSDIPAGHGQLTTFHALAETAAGAGMPYMFTGENAGGLFLESGFDAFATTDDFLSYAATLTEEQKLAALVRWPPLSPLSRQYLTAMGGSLKGCETWRAQRTEADRAFFAPLIRHCSWPAILQLKSQVWGGIPYRNVWLPAERALGGNSRFVSPFMDLGMIRFTASLPLRYKFDNGVTKALLRSTLEAATGIRTPKRASPNPSRLWTLASGFSDLPHIYSRLKPHYRSLLLRNLSTGGRHYARVMATAATGLWLSAHSLGDV